MRKLLKELKHRLFMRKMISKRDTDEMFKPMIDYEKYKIHPKRQIYTMLFNISEIDSLSEGLQKLERQAGRFSGTEEVKSWFSRMYETPTQAMYLLPFDLSKHVRDSRYIEDCKLVLCTMTPSHIALLADFKLSDEYAGKFLKVKLVKTRVTKHGNMFSRRFWYFMPIPEIVHRELYQELANEVAQEVSAILSKYGICVSNAHNMKVEAYTIAMNGDEMPIEFDENLRKYLWQFGLVDFVNYIGSMRMLSIPSHEDSTQEPPYRYFVSAESEGEIDLDYFDLTEEMYNWCAIQILFDRLKYLSKQANRLKIRMIKVINSRVYVSNVFVIPKLLSQSAAIKSEVQTILSDMGEPRKLTRRIDDSFGALVNIRGNKITIIDSVRKQIEFHSTEDIQAMLGNMERIVSDKLKVLTIMSGCLSQVIMTILTIVLIGIALCQVYLILPEGTQEIVKNFCEQCI